MLIKGICRGSLKFIDLGDQRVIVRGREGRREREEENLENGCKEAVVHKIRSSLCTGYMVSQVNAREGTEKS